LQKFTSKTAFMLSIYLFSSISYSCLFKFFLASFRKNAAIPKDICVMFDLFSHQGVVKAFPVTMWQEIWN